MASLAAVAAMNVPTRIVACVGFGVDSYHGACHANWLENVAALTAEGAFLGATALLNGMPEARLYIDAVNAADLARSRQPSIANGSMCRRSKETSVIITAMPVRTAASYLSTPS